MNSYCTGVPHEQNELVSHTIRGRGRSCLTIKLSPLRILLTLLGSVALGIGPVTLAANSPAPDKPMMNRFRLPCLPYVVLAGGAWIQLSTWLDLRFFAENEARLSLIPEHRYNGGGTAWRSPDAQS